MSQSPALPSPNGSPIGARIPMVDSVDKVTGAGKYADDLTLPGTLVGKILHSPHAHAHIRSNDTSESERLAGVYAVVTGRETPVKYGILPIGHDETIFAVNKVLLAGPRGQREMPLAEFYVNDGIIRMAKSRDEIATGIRVPPTSAGWSGTYKKLRIRQSIDYPLAGVAVAMRKDGEGNCLQARVAVNAVNPAPQLVKTAELLKGKPYDPELVEQVAHDAIRTSKPLRTSASTPQYRRQMVRVFFRRALREVWGNGHIAGSAE